MDTDHAVEIRARRQERQEKMVTRVNNKLRETRGARDRHALWLHRYSTELMELLNEGEVNEERVDELVFYLREYSNKLDEMHRQARFLEELG